MLPALSLSPDVYSGGILCVTSPVKIAELFIMPPKFLINKRFTPFAPIAPNLIEVLERGTGVKLTKLPLLSRNWPPIFVLCLCK